MPPNRQTLLVEVQALDRSAAALRSAAANIAALGKSAQATNLAIGFSTQSFQRAGRQITVYRNAAGQFTTTQLAMATATNDYGKAAVTATKSTKALTSGLHGTLAVARGMFIRIAALAAATAVLGFATRGVIGAAIDFEDSFTGVRKTMDLTAREFAKLSRGLRDLALVLPINVNEFNKIAEIAGQLGIEGRRNILKFVEVIAGIGISTDIAATQAAVSVAKLAKIMQLPIQQVDRLASALVFLGNNFAAFESEIIDFAIRFAGVAKSLNFTTAEVLAISAAFIQAGVKVERGGTAVQRVLIEINEAVVTQNENLTLLAKLLGTTEDAYASLFRADPAEAFIQFIEVLTKSGEQGVRVLQALGLEGARVVGGFLSVAAQGDELRKAIEQGTIAFDKNVDAQIELQKFLDRTSSDVQLLRNNFNEIGITIGTALLPAVTALSRVGIKVARGLAIMIEKTELMKLALIGLATIFGALFGPVGLIPAAVAAFFLDWSKVFEQLPRPVQSAVIKITEFLDGMVNSFIGALNAVIGGINNFSRRVQQIPGLGKAAGFFLPDDKLLSEIEFRSNLAKGLRLSRLSDNLVDKFGSFIEKFKSFAESRLIPEVSGDIDEFLLFLDDLLSSLEDTGKGVDLLADGIIDLFEALEHGISVSEAAILELTHLEQQYANTVFRAAVETEKLVAILGTAGLLSQMSLFQHALFNLGVGFRQAEETITQFLQRVVTASVDATREALDRILGRPSEEQARLQLKLAALERRRLLLFQGGATEDELEPLLIPIDREIKAINNLLNLRRRESDILRLQATLADQTLLSEAEKIAQSRFLIKAIADQTALLAPLNLLLLAEGLARAGATRELNAFATALSGAKASLALPAGQAAGNITIHVNADGARAQDIARTVSEQLEQELRNAGFAGSFIGSGTFVPPG